MTPTSQQLICAELEEIENSFIALREIFSKGVHEFDHLVSAGADTLQKGGTIFFAGNGGSFADAQHMAAEFTGKLSRDRRPLSSIVLGANSSSISAIGNDFGYDKVFARELRGLGSENSTVIGFTTSGRSQNLIELAKASVDIGAKFFAFTGQSECELAKYGKTIKVPSLRTERVQEMHTALGHLFCLLVEEKLGIFNS